MSEPVGTTNDMETMLFDDYEFNYLNSIEFSND